MTPIRPATETASSDVRLQGDVSQAVFRVLLDTVARPGVVKRFPERALRCTEWPVLLPMLALADVGSPVAFIGPEAGAYLRLVTQATGAVGVALERAAFVAATEPVHPGAVLSLDRGSALEPERGARLALHVADVADVDPGRPSASPGRGPVVVLRGPGVEGHRALRVDGVSAEVFRALVEVNAAFPRGVDTHFATRDGRTFAIPRSTAIEVVG